MAQQSIELTEGFWSTYQQTGVNNLPYNTGVTSSLYNDPQAAVAFLDWNYHFKSVVTEILHDAGRPLIPSHSPTISFHSTVQKHDVLSSSAMRVQYSITI
jgi:hypothetical protein